MPDERGATGPVVIVGSQGFIGRRIAHALGPVRPVVGLVRPGRPLGPGELAIDLDDLAAVEAMLADLAPGAVVHAAWSGHPRSAGIDYGAQRANLTVATNVALACGRSATDHVVFLSSGGAINRTAHRARTPPAYGWAKRATEAVFAATAHDFGYRLTILRPTAVYGPGQDLDRGLGAITVFLAAMLRGEPISLYGGGAAARDYLHVDDLARCAAAVLAHRAVGTFEVGGPELVRLDEVVALLEATLGQPATVRHERATGLDQEQVELDARPVSAATGWQPTTRVLDALPAIAVDVATRLGLVAALPPDLRRRAGAKA